MCSNIYARLSRVCLAIDELENRPAGKDAAPAGRQEGTDDDGMPARLAAIWAMVADADPELARRVPGYLNAARVSSREPRR